MSMKFVLLINLKLLIIANPFLLHRAEHDNFSVLLALSYSLAEKISCSAELNMKKVLKPLGHAFLCRFDQNWIKTKKVNDI